MNKLDLFQNLSQARHCEDCEYPKQAEAIQSTHYTGLLRGYTRNDGFGTGFGTGLVYSW